MATDVRVIVDDNGIRQLLASDEMRDYALEVADPIVAQARMLAPKRSGQGAAAIHSEALFAGFEWLVRIGWTDRRFYMRFQDQGTRGPWAVDARHFLEIALEGARS